jgi:hypothetical protein
MPHQNNSVNSVLLIVTVKLYFLFPYLRNEAILNFATKPVTSYPYLPTFPKFFLCLTSEFKHSVKVNSQKTFPVTESTQPSTSLPQNTRQRRSTCPACTMTIYKIWYCPGRVTRPGKLTHNCVCCLHPVVFNKFKYQCCSKCSFCP